MGAGKSTLNKSKKHVFENELKTMDEIVSKIITSDNKFINQDYNFLFQDTCSRYTLMYENELNKHVKVDLENLHSSIYLIPKKEVVKLEKGNEKENEKIKEEQEKEQKKDNVTKSELCSRIARHYMKILYLFSLIKTVYDLEHLGDDSIAGIMHRNIKQIGDVIEISFCSIPHKDYDLKPSDKINFDYLQGFKIFIENFLTPVERYAFLEQFKAIFGRRSRQKIVDGICSDSLVPLDDYERVYKYRFRKEGYRLSCKHLENDDKSEEKKHKYRKDIDLMFPISENNPILHTHYCMSHKKYIITANKSVSQISEVFSLYRKMHENYKKNIDDVIAILLKLVEKEGSDNYKLKNISNEELQEIIKETKQKIVLFYIQSIVDYQIILDIANTIPEDKRNLV
jgi:hypothetical protein